MSQEKPSKKMEKLTMECRMSDAATAQELMRVCFPIGEGGVKDAWNRARHVLGWSDRRIRAVWYGEAQRIDHHEMRDLTNAKAASFVARLDSLRASMLAADADFYAEEARALAAVSRALSGEIATD